MQQWFSSRLLTWYRSYGRVLPWRTHPDPYAVWLSEIIMQQTRMEQGLPYWKRMIERFPSVTDLAAASTDEVLRLWQGLGYYSRARNLHRAAQQVVLLGDFPHTSAELRQLSGVGEYTAAAIASLAYGEPVAAVDGNVFRVLSRFFGEQTPINTTVGKRLFASIAQSLLPEQNARDFNQAMMDFGALQCTPHHPDCTICPLIERCTAYRMNTVEELPVKERKLRVAERRMDYLLILCQGHTAVRRRSAGDIWQGLWECFLLPQSGLPQWGTDAELLVSGLQHRLTHRLITASLRVLHTDVRPELPEDYVWIPTEELKKYALPQMLVKLLHRAGLVLY